MTLTLPYASPEELALDADRVALARTLLIRWSSGDAPAFPAATLVIGRRGRLLEPCVVGRMGPRPSDRPIERDAIFLLASITKPLVYTAALQLVERGELSLTDRVVDHFPEFASHGKERTLVFHLLTHTSGLPDMPPNNVELRRSHAPLAAFVEAAIHAQPLFGPGTNHRYQSLGTLLTAAIVERITGRTIHDVVRRELFDPLGMHATRLGSSGLDESRLVLNRLPPDQEEAWGWNSRYWRELGAPWGAAFASGEDLARVCAAMLAGGKLGNERIVSPATVAAATTNRLHDLPDVPEAVRRTKPWGLGWAMPWPCSRDGWGDLLGPRTYGHIGATGTMCWIDPDREGFLILLTTGPLDETRDKLVRLSNVVASAFL